MFRFLGGSLVLLLVGSLAGLRANDGAEGLATARPEVRVYQVADLTDSPERDRSSRSLSRLIETVRYAVASETWHGGEFMIYPYQDQLVVRHQPQVHQMIERLLEALRKSQKEDASSASRQAIAVDGGDLLPKGTELKLYPVGHLVPHASQRITVDALAKHYQHLRELIVRTVLPELWEQGATITAVPTAGVLVVYHHGQGHAEVQSLLTMLGETQTARQVPEDAPQAGQGTQPETPAASPDMILQTYRLLPQGDAFTLSESDLRRVKQRIETDFAPGTWDGQLHYVDLMKGRIVVRHSPEVHEQVVGYLHALQAIAEPSGQAGVRGSPEAPAYGSGYEGGLYGGSSEYGGEGGIF